MSNARMIVSKERWDELEEKERSWFVYDTMISIDKRLTSLEKAKILNKSLSFMGGVVGGAAAFLGIKIWS